MKEFKVYIGMSEDNMTEVLAANLKNDVIPETFSIRHTNRSLVEFPTRYVKIVPLSLVGTLLRPRYDLEFIVRIHLDFISRYGSFL